MIIFLLNWNSKGRKMSLWLLNMWFRASIQPMTKDKIISKKYVKHSFMVTNVDASAALVPWLRLALVMEQLRAQQRLSRAENLRAERRFHPPAPPAPPAPTSSPTSPHQPPHGSICLFMEPFHSSPTAAWPQQRGDISLTLFPPSHSRQRAS